MSKNGNTPEGACNCQAVSRERSVLNPLVLKKSALSIRLCLGVSPPRHSLAGYLTPCLASPAAGASLNSSSSRLLPPKYLLMLMFWDLAYVRILMGSGRGLSQYDSAASYSSPRQHLILNEGFNRWRLTALGFRCLPLFAGFGFGL